MPGDEARRYAAPNAISNAHQLCQVFEPFAHRAVIRVYNGTGNVIETHEQASDFKEP